MRRPADSREERVRDAVQVILAVAAGASPYPMSAEELYKEGRDLYNGPRTTAEESLKAWKREPYEDAVWWCEVLLPCYKPTDTLSDVGTAYMMAAMRLHGDEKSLNGGP